MILRCYVNDDTLLRLTLAAADLGRDIEELAETAISEAAIKAYPVCPAPGSVTATELLSRARLAAERRGTGG